MHDHDLDRIAALADGSLDDEIEARALVESCSECRAEYEGQRAVLELLASSPDVEMGDVERARLHRDLWTELTAPTHAAARPNPWWLRLSYTAAGLFVLVGLVAVIGGQLRFGAGDSAAVETFSDISSGLDEADGGRAAPTADTDALSDGAGQEESATTTAAAEALPFPFPELADEARARRLSGDQAYDSAAETKQVDECLESLGLEHLVVVDELELDRSYLLLMPEPATNEQTDDQTVTFVALDVCEVVYVDG